jgi:type II protein arginine methyltransferase
MMALVRQMLTHGLDDEALVVAARAMALSDVGSEAYMQAKATLSKGVPPWHFLIVRDRARNQAYDAALRRAVFPGCKVLEIGTGTGLLAMMAARAGAAEVITCEMDPAVAHAARDVIAANGFADRVKVVSGHSTTLDANRDLGGRADILVSEIVSNDLLGEGVIPAHTHAMRELLKPGAVVIPPRGRVRIALTELRRPSAGLLGEVEGFQLSAFNRLARTFREVPVGSDATRLRSDAADAFDFDFAAPPAREGRASIALTSAGGPVHGVIQWISLDFDAELQYENCPAPGGRSCWGTVFWPFDRVVETVAGQVITVGAGHEMERIRFWLDSGKAM